MLHIVIGVICGVIGYNAGRWVTHSKLERLYKRLDTQSLIDNLITKEVSRREKQRDKA